MSNMKKYYPTAAALYITYFVLGIAVTVMGQYKQDFAAMWGAQQLADNTFDISGVLSVIAAVGLGRLISFPIAGPLSDKFGRKLSALIGMTCFAVFFIGITLTSNIYVAYLLAVISGAANSFLDTSITPSCMEIFVENGAIANLFTKFSISIAQFLLPFCIGIVAANSLPFQLIFFVTAGLVIADGILIAVLPFPPMNGDAKKATASSAGEKHALQPANKIRFTPSTIILICLGFTTSSTFMIWLNCNQELGKMYGMSASDAGMIQSFYSIGIVCAVLLTSVLLKKNILKPTKVLMLYPSIALATLLMVYFVQTPTICLIGGFLLGYSAAGGVLQLVTSTANEMFPTNKGKITAIVMIASSIANYVILNLAGLITRMGGAEAPRYVILLNVAVTAVGILLSIILNMRFDKDAQSETPAQLAGSEEHSLGKLEQQSKTSEHKPALQ